MNNPIYYNVHNRFKWNGLHLSKEDLCYNASSLIKEGTDFEKDTGNFLLDWFDEKPFIELTTSGTTGAPKSIQIKKQAMVISALSTGDFFNLKIGDKALHCLSTKYIAGKMMLVRGLILGLEMDFVAPSSNPLLNNVTDYDFVAMVPLQVQNSISELKKVEKLIIGGAKINESLRIELSKLPTQVYETYGMTETITHIAAKKIGERAFSILPNVTISQDERQCLVIDAPRISNEKVVTNDLVELVSKNQFVLLGRIDNVINSGGVKLIPEQIEEKLSGKILTRFFVTGIPDDALGEKLILVIESVKQAFDETIFKVLNKYEKPKEIRFVPKFKETESGKVMRKETINSFL
ncbi:AMP-binding protein [Flavobacterium sp.]|uniref:AMP-binding protein n=1 Tax=Flavobacterium sp. TaxID=239 RepID=UPI002B4B4F92|nr:AMP-binding protein [Flavobacterium sp.]HLF51413.1 AMP-binding protein [Flavobacterium sp.]